MDKLQKKYLQLKVSSGDRKISVTLPWRENHDLVKSKLITFKD